MLAYRTHRAVVALLVAGLLAALGAPASAAPPATPDGATPDGATPDAETRSEEAEHVPAIVPGRPAHGSTDFYDGIKVFLRYQDPDHLYVVHVNRRDGRVLMQRKHGPGEGSGAYVSLEDQQPPALSPDYGAVQRLSASVVDLPDGSVRLRLFVNGALHHEAVDRGQTAAGAPLRAAGRVGLRTDNLEFELASMAVHAAGADGRPAGPALHADDFDHPNGLITNQRIQSVGDPTWLVTSGSLIARDGRAWSGVPDDVRPDPESRFATNSSTFRMVSHDDTLTDVAVHLDVVNHGYIADPAEVRPPNPPGPPPYPTGEGSVSTIRLEGRSNAHVAIAVSRRGFPSGASEAVLLPTTLAPAAITAPGLAGQVRGPVLLTGPSRLHPDTAVELARLGVGRVHLVGEISASVASELRGRGIEVRAWRDTPERLAAAIAETTGRRDVLLAVTDDAIDAMGMAGAAAQLRRPVLLTAADRLHPAARAALDALEVRSVTVIGTSLDPAVIAQLRTRGIEVTTAGFSRYSAARAGAEAQVAAGAEASTIWLVGGARPFFALSAGAAAAARGQVLLVVDGTDLGALGPDDLGYVGYESRHWARMHRHALRRVVAVGPTNGLANRVVEQVRAPQRTVVAGMSDIAASVHLEAITWVLEQDIAGGFPDDTYRPGDPVTRGQMATFLTRALELAAPASPPPFTDVSAEATHAQAIAAVSEAGIAGGFPDGTYRPGAAVTRGQMATFLARGLGLAGLDDGQGASTGFDDVAADNPHAPAIGAVSRAGIAGGFTDGTYRPGQDVSRGQMATFLYRALD